MSVFINDDDIIEEEHLHKIVFTDEVQAAIEQVLQTTDPLDRPDFDSTDYINQMFPNEQSLSNIDDVISKMKYEISAIDDNIRDVVRGQSNSNQDGCVALEEAQKVINQLFIQITEIKTRAEKTEDMVKGITRDIKQLDCAKKNLTSAITTLNHLHMLVSGVESLTKLSEKRLYGEIINPLQAITEVNQHFQQYVEIPHIKDLSNRVTQIQSELAAQITQDFQNFFTPNTTEMKMSLSQLRDACLVISVLDAKVKRDLLKWFINLRLQEYLQLFHENQDIAWLDKIDKRYAWLKRHLLDFEDKFNNVFPPDWNISERISVQFCNVTKTELSKVMTNRRHEIDVKLLLFAITKTQNFELLLSKRFTGCTLTESGTAGDVATNSFANRNEKIDTNLLNSIASSSDNLNEETLEQEVFVTPFKDLIGACFKNYLDIYTDSIDKNLSELIERFIEMEREANRKNQANKSPVFLSCADLFVFYKKCMVQCNQLSNEKPMYDLTMLFKKYLREYGVKILESKIPKFTSTQTSLGTSMSLLTKDFQNLSTAAGQVIHNFLKEGEAPRFTEDEIIRLCCTLTTAEYCLETVQQLEDKLKEKIEKTFVENVDLSDEKDIFHNIISNCIQLLVQDMEYGCDPALIVMAKIQWHQINNVGDQSPFINSIISHFKTTIPIIRENLATSRKYYTQFCLKFVNSFIPKYITNLYKCRLTNAQDGNNNILGCEQLLLDTHSLKTVLLDLPSIGSQINRKAPPSYTKVVIKGMTKAEMIVKIVMAPINPSASFCEQYFKLLPESNINEFQKILDMKNVKRIDQTNLVELFKKFSYNIASAQSSAQSTTSSSGISSMSSESIAISGNNQSNSNNYEVDSGNSQETDKGRTSIKKLEKLIKKRLPN